MLLSRDNNKSLLNGGTSGMGIKAVFLSCSKALISKEHTGDQGGTCLSNKGGMQLIPRQKRQPLHTDDRQWEKDPSSWPSSLMLSTIAVETARL